MCVYVCMYVCMYVCVYVCAHLCSVVCSWTSRNIVMVLCAISTADRPAATDCCCPRLTIIHSPSPLPRPRIPTPGRSKLSFVMKKEIFHFCFLLIFKRTLEVKPDSCLSVCPTTAVPHRTRSGGPVWRCMSVCLVAFPLHSSTSASHWPGKCCFRLVKKSPLFR